MQSLRAADPLSVGGYQLFARLGAGGMGQVYLARTQAGRPLALKTMRPELGLDPTFGERFAREIRHADRVRSPWTVTVVDFSPAGSQPQWLATEYVAAPSLAEWVAGHGPLPAASVIALAAELVQALHAVHQAGLAHRDVKPSNVLLAGARPLLIDFGIARAAEDSRHTRTGGVIGSPGYMAPEQATAGASAEPGDIFALGAVLVYAATGRGPFDRIGENPSTPALLYRVVHEEPELRGVPEVLLPLVRACLTKEPGDRPTASQAAAVLPASARTAGQWADCRPPGLEAELTAREADTTATLTGPAPERSPDHVPTAVDSPASRSDESRDIGADNSPASSADAVTRTADGHPVARPRPDPAPVPEPRDDSGDQDAITPAPAAKRQPARVRRRVMVAAGALVLVAASGLLVHTLVGSDSDHTGSTGGSGASTTPAEVAGFDPDALPSSWAGTWIGTGPGNPDGNYSMALHTDSYKVTFTLHAGRVGQLVGQQVSSVHDQETGRDDGCTESLELKSVSAGTARFAATSPHPTDPTTTVTCGPGNSYQLSMIDGTLRFDPGSQGLGAPDTFTRR
jgi:serine/threonine protein kinase